MPLIPALGRQRQEDFCEFEPSLVYKMSSSISIAVTQRNPDSKKKKIKRGVGSQVKGSATPLQMKRNSKPVG